MRKAFSLVCLLEKVSGRTILSSPGVVAAWVATELGPGMLAHVTALGSLLLCAHGNEYETEYSDTNRPRTKDTKNMKKEESLVWYSPGIYPTLKPLTLRPPASP